MGGPGHHHHADGGTRALSIAVAINLGLTVVQVVAGVLSGSLALVADALHNFSDAAGLLLALVARRVARRPADRRRTFGYARAEIVGGLMQLTAIVVIAFTLLVEAVSRAAEGVTVEGWTVVVVAGVGLAVDSGTALLTWRYSHESVNLRAAFLHNLADAAASLAVMVAGAVILVTGWGWIDLVVSAGIALYVGLLALPPLRRCVRLSMLSAPEDLGVEEVAATILGVDGVHAVAHVHVWSMSEHALSVEAVARVDPELAVSDADRVRRRIEVALADRHGVAHATIALTGRIEDEALVPEH